MIDVKTPEGLVVITILIMCTEDRRQDRMHTGDEQAGKSGSVRGLPADDALLPSDDT